MRIKRVVVAGTHSSAGKTTVTIGLIAALVRRGLRVQPYKVGPDYIDSSYHTRAAGRVSRNLDDWMLAPGTLRFLFNKSAQTADISIIEGVMGLYDGIGSTPMGSTASVAKTLKAPVVLVVDAAEMSTSAAAQVLGYQQYDRELDLSGVILNRVSPGPHLDSMKEVIERTTGTVVLGCLPRDRGLELPSRHLGLVPSIEMAGVRERLEVLSQSIEKHVDLDRVLEIADSTIDLADAACPVPDRLPLTRSRSFSGSSQTVPASDAKTPPRSISPTSSTGASTISAIPMLTISSAWRFISAGLPAPSITITSYSAASCR